MSWGEAKKRANTNYSGHPVSPQRQKRTTPPCAAHKELKVCHVSEKNLFSLFIHGVSLSRNTPACVDFLFYPPHQTHSPFLVMYRCNLLNVDLSS